MTYSDTLSRCPSVRAKQTINSLMLGEPPRRDLIESLSVGLEGHLAVLEEEYFAPGSQIVDSEVAGSTFKMVEAYYGGGKTHYLRAVEQVALRNNFATAFVSLTKDECPLTRFDLIFGSKSRRIEYVRPSLFIRLQPPNRIINILNASNQVFTASDGQGSEQNPRWSWPTL